MGTIFYYSLSLAVVLQGTREMSFWKTPSNRRDSLLQWLILAACHQCAHMQVTWPSSGCSSGGTLSRAQLNVNQSLSFSSESRAISKQLLTFWPPSRRPDADSVALSFPPWLLFVRISR